MISRKLTVVPELDPGFMPASVWNREYRQLVQQTSGSRAVQLWVERPSGRRWSFACKVFPDTFNWIEYNRRFIERLVKFLLWAWGGSRIGISGMPEIVSYLNELYSTGGRRAFDNDFLGVGCFGEPIVFDYSTERIQSGGNDTNPDASIQLSGCRIGFDLGGSDRKCAAIIDGEVVFSEEVKWSPYFEENPNYHLNGIQHSLELAASHLPRVDAIGGSAAGVYIDNEPRVGSLFRGVSPADFDRVIRPIFYNLKKRWNDVPFEVANDGDVAAIAGAMAINDHSVLGISMGTSQAAGYVDAKGQVVGWLNELAFAPIDYRFDAPIDEWSGDAGCGVQYFSQQAVARLLPLAGLQVDASIPVPERLELLQSKIANGDERAARIYQTLGIYLGYGIAHYADFYDIRHLFVLGRVTCGEGGEIILQWARRVLDFEFPELSGQIGFQSPNEKMKRHGQAIAAASLPRIKASFI